MTTRLRELEKYEIPMFTFRSEPALPAVEGGDGVLLAGQPWPLHVQLRDQAARQGGRAAPSHECQRPRGQARHQEPHAQEEDPARPAGQAALRGRGRRRPPREAGPPVGGEVAGRRRPAAVQGRLPRGARRRKGTQPTDRG